MVYGRPAHRRQVVSCLIQNGLFVTELEVAGPESAIPGSIWSAPLIVACLGSEEEHRELAERLVLAGAPLIAVTPADCPSRWLEELGAFAVVRGDEDFEGLQAAVVAAGQWARRRSPHSETPRETTDILFGGLIYSATQPWLRAGEEIVALSATEHGVLNALLAGRGSMVSKVELCRQLGGESTPASDAYLKTVVLRIRRKVERLGGDAERLISVRGVGYLLKA